MGKGVIMKRFISCVLTVCMVLSCLAMTDIRTVQAAETDSTTLYFYNSAGWEEVGVYTWAPSEVFGGWPGQTLEPVGEEEGLGEGWYKVDVPVDAVTSNFPIIFNNNGHDSQAPTVDIKNHTNVYLNAESDVAFSSAKEAEDNANTTTIYFYNSTGWEEISAYTYNPELFGGWPGQRLDSAEDELGKDWYKITVPVNAALENFTIIFNNNNNGKQMADTPITDKSKLFVDGASNQFYAKAEDAENPITTAYFYNNRGWEDVHAYIWGDNLTVDEEDTLRAWPGDLIDESDIGDNWYEITIPANPDFHVIFNDGVGGEGRQYDYYIADRTRVFASTDGAETTDVYASRAEAEIALGISQETEVYFLNSKKWDKVGAYVYSSDPAEALGGWNDAMAKELEKADELGKDWLKVTVPAKAPFNIIFCNVDAQEQRAELQVPDQDTVYVTGSNAVYSNDFAAALAEGYADISKASTVYFYNSREWETVNGYVFTREKGKEDDENAPGKVLGAGWPGEKAKSAAEELGENWWKITIPMTITEDTPAFVTINDGANRTEDVKLTAQNDNYVIPTGALFASKEDAEKAAKNAVYDDGCDDKDTNADIEDYDVTYSGKGAELPYITYEAEAAKTNAEVLEKDTTHSEAIQSSASGRQAVKLNDEGDYVEFTLEESANTMVLRYCIPDSRNGSGIDAGLNVYVDGEKDNSLELTSKYAWVYGSYPYFNKPKQGKAHRFYDDVRVKFDKTLSKGTKIRLQKDAENTADYYIIDMIEAELAGPALTQPEGSLSVTDEEFGAIADDGEDDYEAFVKCISKAEETGKEVWIPEGTFDLKERKALKPKGVTIRGAGMWYTNLVGEGVSFNFKGTCKFYDFAMTGMANVRRDSIDLGAFEPATRSTNATIQNIWVEHVKVGVWSANTTNLAIQGCRIRNTFADGINLCSMTNNAVVRNNNIRNTGDDCIAIWPWLADCTGNTIAHNTVQAPDLANGIALYAGDRNVVEDNHVMDIINNGSGICIGSEFSTAKGYHGKTTVRGNLLERSGSWQTDDQYPIGALWIWSTWNPMEADFEVTDNTLKDCSYEGFLFDCHSNIETVTLKNNVIDGATDGIAVRTIKGSTEPGFANVENVSVDNFSGELINNEIPDLFELKLQGKGIYDKQNPSEPASEEPTSEEPTSEIPASEEPTSEKSVSDTLSAEAAEYLIANIGTVTADSKTAIETARKVYDNLTEAQKKLVTNVNVLVKAEETLKTVAEKTTETTKAAEVTQTVKVTSISLKGISEKIAAGKKLELTAEVTPDNAANKALTWEISNQNYATVDEKGVVSVKKAGAGKTVTITATAKDGSGQKATYKIQIMKNAVKKIKVTAKSNSVKAGSELKLKASVTAKKGANKKLTWKSNHTKYATVSSKGVVKAKAAGKGKKVKITATATDGSGKKASITIKIK